MTAKIISTFDVAKRLSSALFDEATSDVVFVVGPDENTAERIHAHRSILALGSEPFYNMLYGDMKEQAEIRIPDATPAAFRILLRALYTNEMDLSFEAAPSVLYLCKKYLLSFLIDPVVEFVANTMSPANVCDALEELIVHDEVAVKCWNMVDARATDVLRSSGFLSLSKETVAQIIRRESLAVDETTVYQSILDWGKSTATSQSLEHSAENIKLMIEDLLGCVRFPVMTMREFAQGPAKSGYLTQEQIIDVYSWHADGSPSAFFSTTLRRGSKPLVCSRFDASLLRKHLCNVTTMEISFGIDFTADKDIAMRGIGIFKRGTENDHTKVDITVIYGGAKLTTEDQFSGDGTVSIHNIMLGSPIQIARGNKCSVVLRYSSGLLCNTPFQVRGQDVVSCKRLDEDVVFTFSDCTTLPTLTASNVAHQRTKFECIAQILYS